jgi:hypothetical protein
MSALIVTSWLVKAEQAQVEALREYLRVSAATDVLDCPDAGRDGDLYSLMVNAECLPGGIPEVHEILWSGPGVRSVSLEAADRRSAS